MNITMFLMIHLCVKVRRNNNIMRARERVFSGKQTIHDLIQFSSSDESFQRVHLHNNDLGKTFLLVVFESFESRSEVLIFCLVVLEEPLEFETSHKENMLRRIVQ